MGVHLGSTPTGSNMIGETERTVVCVCMCVCVCVRLWSKARVRACDTAMERERERESEREGELPWAPRHASIRERRGGTQIS